MILITPSLLAADFAQVGEALRLIKEAGASMIHVDVMDGHFVPDITVGQPVVRSLRKATDLVLDLHLLIERPERYVAEFIEMGADRVAIHAEATPNLHKALGMIRIGGAKAGLALNPCTAVEAASEVMADIDYLLILSADLGFANSSFLPGTLSKVQTACALRRERRLDFAIQVEGSIGEEQIEALGQAGADILVAGSDIFQKDPKTRMAKMMELAASSRQVSRV
ncbi:MAG: ribulose-phosphate 3-epimerase [Terriglobia bacterium]|jgi:ribulose-phosphate 3-epimerase